MKTAFHVLCARAAAAFTVGVLLASCSRAPLGDVAAASIASDEPVAPLARAAAWLWRQQSSDGGWHSATYGLARGGQAYTAFVLHALLEVPPELCAPPSDGIARALDFMSRHVNASGALGLADPDVIEYPNYATAHALRCFVKVGRAQDRPLIERMRKYLLAEQYCEALGFDRDSPAYGGWGFGGARPRGATGHMDLSHTRRVLEAIKDVGASDAQVLARARSFLALVQRHPASERPQPCPDRHAACAAQAAPYDGGFYLSPIVFPANKGGLEPASDHASCYFRSYATATCDGLLALLAAGFGPDAEPVVAAHRWLELHPRLDITEGIAPSPTEPWSDALYFYHLAVRAEVYSALNWPGAWRAEIAALLAAEQRADGSFQNRKCILMKEDDPILCTALAVIALAR
ncbi:MAG: prenyltransferase/squalene oxidase repeat-containing protein [Planctomycetota bacterium]